MPTNPPGVWPRADWWTRGQGEEWLLAGRTHHPFGRRVGHLTVVNPESLGMFVDGDPRACYAIWEDGRTRLKRVSYDIDRAAKRLRLTGLPEDVAPKMTWALRRAE